MALNLSNAANVLKTFYIGPIREQLNNATILLARLDRDESTQMVSGTSFTVPLHKTRNSASGIFRGDTGTLPDAGQQGYSQAIVPNTYCYGKIKVTGPTIAATRNDAGAFIRAIESEIKGCVRDTKRKVNWHLHGDGTGALAYFTAADDTTAFDVDDNQGNAFINLQTGQKVDIIDATDHVAVLGDDNVLNAVSKTDATKYNITLTSGTRSGTADGDYLVDYDSVGRHIMGIDGIIRATDPPVSALYASGLHGLAVASNDWWKAQEFSNSGSNRTMTLELLQDPLSEIAVQSDYSEEDVDFLLSNIYMRDKYLALCQAQKMFVNQMTLDGGFKAVEFNGKPWVVDVQSKRNRVYYPVLSTIKLYRTQDWDWMDKDGAVLSRVSNEDAYEATLFHYGNLGCSARNANGVLKDISD